MKELSSAHIHCLALSLMSTFLTNLSIDASFLLHGQLIGKLVVLLNRIWILWVWSGLKEFLVGVWRCKVLHDITRAGSLSFLARNPSVTFLFALIARLYSAQWAVKSFRHFFKLFFEAKVVATFDRTGDQIWVLLTHIIPSKVDALVLLDLLEQVL